MIHPTNQVNRFIAIDAHKHYLVVGGLSTAELVRKGLMKLEMGKDLTHIVRGATKRPIATPEEVLALTEGIQRQTGHRRHPPPPAAGSSLSRDATSAGCQRLRLPRTPRERPQAGVVGPPRRCRAGLEPPASASPATSRLGTLPVATQQPDPGSPRRHLRENRH
jgi:hypothetical protein